MVEITEAGKEARRKYYQEYRQRKKEEKRKADIRYWNKKGEEHEQERVNQNKK